MAVLHVWSGLQLEEVLVFLWSISSACTTCKTPKSELVQLLVQFPSSRLNLKYKFTFKPIGTRGAHKNGNLNIYDLCDCRKLRTSKGWAFVTARHFHVVKQDRMFLQSYYSERGTYFICFIWSLCVSLHQGDISPANCGIKKYDCDCLFQFLSCGEQMLSEHPPTRRIITTQILGRSHGVVH